VALVGIDIGGTFTDTIVVTDDDVHAVKTPTTDDVISGVVTGFERAMDAATISPDSIDVFTHSSTISLNALLEGDGAKTALITTSNFRDVLEIGETYRDATLLYNPCGNRNESLVPRKHRYEVRERIDENGAVVTPLDDDSVDRAIGRIQAADVESVAICLLHAYRNPAHERAVEERVRDRLPDIDVSISSDVSPTIREYPRTCTTTIDAYVKPSVSSYLSELGTTMRDRGLETPINIMKSDGGVANSDIAAERPVVQLLSGAVGGTMAAAFVGETIGLSDLVTVDMGGTSCDVAMVVNGEPIEVQQMEMQGMKINGPFVDVHTIGAGGGSIAWLDDVNALRVGPKSAGSNPGPACYGWGGERPTVTDANLVLGLMNPETFAGGDIHLDVDAAHRSVREYVAEPLGMETTDAALAIRRVLNSNIQSSIRVITVNKGHDPRDFALVGFGGAGPMHACDVARELGVETVVFPNKAGLLSALGLLVSDVKHQYVRSVIEPADGADLDRINATIASLIKRGREELEAEGVAESDQQFAVGLDMKYANQAHDITVERAVTELSAATLSTFVDSFERIHERKHGFKHQSDAIELTNVRVTATALIDDPVVREPSTGGSVEKARLGTRPVVVDGGEALDVPYYEWESLPTTDHLAGPSIVEMNNSTIWIPPDFAVEIDEDRNVLARRTV